MQNTSTQQCVLVCAWTQTMNRVCLWILFSLSRFEQKEMGPKRRHFEMQSRSALGCAVSVSFLSRGLTASITVSTFLHFKSFPIISIRRERLVRDGFPKLYCFWLSLQSFYWHILVLMSAFEPCWLVQSIPADYKPTGRNLKIDLSLGWRFIKSATVLITSKPADKNIVWELRKQSLVQKIKVKI